MNDQKSEPEASKCQKSKSSPAIHRTMSGHSAKFVSDVSESFNCDICLELLDDPRQCLEGHLFCLECVTRWLNHHPDNQSCPTCRTPISQEGLARNLVVANMIRQLEVKCANSSTGDGSGSCCEWRGPLERFEAHCAAECGDVFVDCPNSARGCNEKVLRKNSETHRLECRHELVACAECSGEIERGVMDRHLRDECPAVAVVCVHGCGVSHARRDAALHAEDCPEVLVDCPNSARDCSEKVLRKHIAMHRLECQHEVVACVECGKEVERGEMDKHLHECPLAAVVCVHGCGVSHARRNAALHAEGCPEVLMPCPYAEHGCAVVDLRRKDYVAHQETSVVPHMELLQKHMKRENDQLRERNEVLQTQMRRENDQLKHEIVALKQINADFSRQLAQKDSPQVRVSWSLELKEADQYSKHQNLFLRVYGKYEVYLSVNRNEDSLAVYVHAAGGDHFPVGIEGTELACGDKHNTFTANGTIKKSGSGFGFRNFMPWEEAEALAVDGKITITATIKLSIPEGTDFDEPVYDV